MNKSRSLKKIMVFFIVFVIMIPMMIFTYISYRVYEKNVEESVAEYSLQLTRQISTNVDLKLNSYKDMLIQIITNNNTLSLLRGVIRSETEHVENIKLSTQIIQYSAVAPEFKSIAFIGENQYIKTIYRWNDMELRDQIYRETKEHKNQFRWFGGREQTYKDTLGNHKEQVFSVSKEVFDLVNGGTTDRVIVIDIQNRAVEDLCNKITNQQLPMTWCIVDADGSVLFADNQFFPVANIGELIDYAAYRERESYYTEGIYENRKQLVSSADLEVNDWRIITVLDYDYIRNKAAESLRPILLAMFLILVVMAIGMAWMLRGVARPVNYIATLMKYPMKGDFMHKAEERYSGIEEIETLRGSYNFMLDEINSLVAAVYEEGEQKRIVQIKALESQINPHFLYNTLDTIKWTALMQQGEQAAAMASMLSRLLHISISGGSEQITVRDEIEHVKAYVGIQKFRMDIEFEVVYMVDAETEALLVPKILLQPFVENSILHGFKKGMKGLIEILVFCRGERLIMQVNDNGSGIAPEKIEDLGRDNSRKSQRFSSIGVSNVKERIRLICGAEYGVEIKSRLGYGTTVTITLPVNRREGDSTE